MSRNLSPDDVQAIKTLISEQRLSTFRALAANDADAIELHQATMGLGGALMAVMSTVEIALRNAVCDRLTTDLGTADWLHVPPAPFNWSQIERNNIDQAIKKAKRAEYAKLSNAQKTALDGTAFPNGPPAGIGHSTLARRRQDVLAVSDGQVVAQLTFFFWKRLFSEQYERTLWKRSLKRVFPNKTLSRPDVATQMEQLYQARNRLAHHEPIYGSRLSKIVGAIDFFKDNLGARRPDPESPVAKLILPQRDALDAQLAIFTSTWTRLVETSAG